jgi:predicted CXXCH cytochrome family protein
MMTSNLSKSSMEKCSTIICVMAIGTFLNLADARCEEINGQSGTCVCSEQLKDPSNRSEYRERLRSYLKQGVPSGEFDYESLSANMVNASFGAMQPNDLDPFSYECVNCHDGSTATITSFRHPVGIYYPGYSMDGRSFISREALNRRIVLIDGKIGCLSCHNPLNPAGDHLVMSNDRSKLCLSCHIK